MRTWRLGKVIEQDPINLLSGDYAAIKIGYFNGTENGTETHDIEVHLGNDGYLFLCEVGDMEKMVYLYPEQVKAMLKLINDLHKKVGPLSRGYRK
jgi:hypothetical protein